MTITDAPGHPSMQSEEELTEAELDSRDRFEALVARLSRQSVEKHFAAYEDIPWDDPAFAVVPTDARWAAAVFPALRETEWFQQQSPERQAEIGIYLAASLMKVGLQFESVLKRGLLEFAATLPNGDPMFRYAYHETVEEAQHAMMFQEFVNRSGYDVPGLPPHIAFASRRIVQLGRVFPELFFMFVLGGEDPIDYAQREGLRTNDDLPPVLERIMRIHVTEEARHLSFARHYLKLQALDLGPVRRLVLGVGTPLILGVMAQLMLRVPPHLVDRFEIPDEVVREAYGSPEYVERTRAALRKVRRLSREIGIVNPLTRRLWKSLGIWDED